MYTVKNFAFDLYGTLVDIRTDENSEKFRKKFIAKYGKKFGDADFFKSYEEIMKSLPPLLEPNILRVFADIADAGGVYLTREDVEEIAVNFRKLSTEKLKLYPFVRGTLRKLKERGASVIVVSNAQAAFTLGEIKKLGLDVFCDGVELSSDFGRKKPAKEFFLYALKKYGFDPSETLYVGNDIKCDVLGVKAVGLKTAYIYTKISPSDDSLKIAEGVADFTVKNHAQLKKLLLSLCN